MGKSFDGAGMLTDFAEYVFKSEVELHGSGVTEWFEELATEAYITANMLEYKTGYRPKITWVNGFDPDDFDTKFVVLKFNGTEFTYFDGKLNYWSEVIEDFVEVV